MKENRKNWILILLEFAKSCRVKILLSVVCAILSVIGGFIPFIAAYNLLNKFIECNINISGILLVCAMCLLGYFMKILFYGLSTTLSHVSAYTILREIRLRIAERFVRVSLGVIGDYKIGDLKNMILDKVESIEPPLAHLIPEFTSYILLPVLVFIWLLLIDWRMGLALLIAPILALFPMKAMMKNYNQLYKEYVESSNYVNSVIVEYVEGIEVVKVFNQSTKSYEKFTKAIDLFKNITVKWFSSTWKSANLMMAIMPTTLLGTLSVGLELAQRRMITPSQLIICLILSLSVVEPLLRIVGFVDEIKAMEYAIEEADELLNLPVLLESRERINIKDYSIEMRDVSFSYNEGQSVLNQIAFKIPQNSFTALVGTSGGGKSTIARLIVRFWDVSGGAIFIGGVNIKDIPLGQLHEIISYVTQDNFLFRGSIKDNIRLGNPNADDQEIYKAASAACCDEFVQKLPDGYETSAGEAGKVLSGGEMQRIAIARAILKNAPIVILDEATAFTDPENEEKIQKSIMELTKGKTLIVIAHRLSTIQKASQIVVIKNGSIEKIGTHQDLLENCPLYLKMWKSHIGAKNWAVSGRGNQ